jgi:hypothetical protein
MSKITLSTVKSFIRKNDGKLFINVKSSFDGMTDCCESLHDGFQPAKKSKLPECFSNCIDNTLGIAGAWFVGSSRDYFREYSDQTFTGITVSNCCGHFVLAIKK